MPEGFIVVGEKTGTEIGNSGISEVHAAFSKKEAAKFAKKYTKRYKEKYVLKSIGDVRYVKD